MKKQDKIEEKVTNYEIYVTFMQHTSNITVKGPKVVGKCQ